MKPGWQTSEFWLNVGQQVVVLLVLFGVIQPQNAQGVQEQVAKDILALCTLAVSAAAVIHYVQGRIHLKAQAPSQSGSSFRAGLLLVAALGLAGPALAAPPPPAGVKCCCPCGPGCACSGCRCTAVQPVAILPWRSQLEQRVQQLEQQLRSQPAPPAIQHHYYYPPKQELPIAGAPKQDLPIQGAPKQDLPIQGAPRQDLPTPGAPKQDLPAPGAPKQQMPLIPGAPKQDLPAGPTRYTRFALYRRP